MTYEVAKRRKRLMIVDADGGVVYCPPNFLRPVTSREDFAEILDGLNRTGKLDGQALTAFETRFNPRRR